MEGDHVEAPVGRPRAHPQHHPGQSLPSRPARPRGTGRELGLPLSSPRPPCCRPGRSRRFEMSPLKGALLAAAAWVFVLVAVCFVHTDVLMKGRLSEEEDE